MPDPAAAIHTKLEKKTLRFHLFINLHFIILFISLFIGSSVLLFPVTIGHQSMSLQMKPEAN